MNRSSRRRFLTRTATGAAAAGVLTAMPGLALSQEAASAPEVAALAPVLEAPILAFSSALARSSFTTQISSPD